MRSRRALAVSAISVAALSGGGIGLAQAFGADQRRTPTELDDTAKRDGFENYMDWVAGCLRERGTNATYDTRTGTLSFDPRADDSDDLLGCIQQLADRSTAAPGS